MKFIKYLLISPLFLMIGSCNSQSKDGTENSQNLDSPTIEFSSEIRPNKLAWNINEIYTDTLVYVDSNWDYDYAFSTFKKQNGKTVSLMYNEKIDPLLSGATFEIIWAVDSFYEAGEGDALYFAENLQSYKVLKKPPIKLVISGNKIWVREQPKTGKLAFTLDDGAVCTVLEKGEAQEIRGLKDYWYKIEYEGKVGWVFGSQTSKKQMASENSFESFVKAFLQTCFYGKNMDSLIHFESPVVQKFINSQMGFSRLHNIGLYCVIGGYNFYNDSGGRYYGTVYPKMDSPTFYKQQTPQGGFCEKSSSPDGIYYKLVDALASYVDGSDDFSTKEISIPLKYKDGLKIKVTILHEHWIIKTMYFVIAEDQWWLVVVDDCDCSA
jgi:SH3 domain-containing protein